ncbi:MAG: enoyl-CoA hydratase-related protein [Gammaproteobacteria bacterium]|jgi:enoyl-CoA hydratase|nr:enoyl-CoA hydratase-related protein [Gammaproteobacteria bacterium]MDX2460847.1 enoyl-CoA hydratase-related protein [Gammaproteobacteria bacterium]
MAKQIQVERDGPIATVVLNRPRKHNAMTRSMWHKLGEAIVTLSADNDVRCVVLRGAGSKAFSSGNDIGEFEKERGNIPQARRYGADMKRTIDALQSCRHPIVALINGICVGGGLELAANCDIRICGESSRFGAPINKLGLVMSYAELESLLNLVGRAATLEILLEGRIFGADEARAKGLVQRIVADDKVEEESYATARRITEGAPLVARWHKKFIDRLSDPAMLSKDELDEGFLCFGTRDFEIGMKAFLEKKKPEFSGR